MGVAQSIGLQLTHREVKGTIDEKNVLGALADLAEGDPTNADLFAEAAERVQGARSAGVEGGPSAGLPHREEPDVATTQLRYRSEMVDIFTDLAIDVGLRLGRELVPAA
jgi:hypothetical protein